MPFNPSGIFTLPAGYLAVPGQTIHASQHNPPLEDIAAGLSLALLRDGRAPMVADLSFNGHRATGAGDAQNPQDYVTLSQVMALLGALDGVPIGSLTFFTGSAAPTNWVFANGASLSRAAYPEYWGWVQASGNLAATEGAKTLGQYGPGNGSTTFTVPNLMSQGGTFIRPTAVGSSGWPVRSIGTFQADEIASHAHAATFSGNPVPPHTHTAPAYTLGSGTTAFRTEFSATPSGRATSSAGGHTPSGSVSVSATGGSETRPKNVAFPVIIKAR